MTKKRGTVIGVQVENETGLLGNAREVSDEADAAFAADVPASFVSYMRGHTAAMKEDVKTAVEKGKESGQETRRSEEGAEEREKMTGKGDRKRADKWKNEQEHRGTPRRI